MVEWNVYNICLHEGMNHIKLLIIYKRCNMKSYHNCFCMGMGIMYNNRNN